jgi:hypothetical protein
VRGIFGPKKDKLRGKFRKLRNEKLQNILSTWYCYSNDIRTHETGWTEERKNVTNFQWRKYYRKKPPEKTLVG